MVVFTSFTYVQFVQTPKYVSTSTVLIPENKTTNLGGLSGLASQFGLSIPPLVKQIYQVQLFYLILSQVEHLLKRSCTRNFIQKI